MTTLLSIAIFMSLAFLYYGISCLILPKMKVEFERFGLSDTERVITGFTQILGSMSILIGIYLPWLGFFGAIGLALQMLLGVLQRIKVKDPILLIAPAFTLLILNAYLAYLFYLQLNFG